MRNAAIEYHDSFSPKFPWICTTDDFGISPLYYSTARDFVNAVLACGFEGVTREDFMQHGDRVVFRGHVVCVKQ